MPGGYVAANDSSTTHLVMVGAVRKLNTVEITSPLGISRLAPTAPPLKRLNTADVQTADDELTAPRPWAVSDLRLLEPTLA